MYEKSQIHYLSIYRRKRSSQNHDEPVVCEASPICAGMHAHTHARYAKYCKISIFIQFIFFN